MLLLDVFLLDDLQVIEESKSKGTMKVRGTFQRAEEANSNNRVYPKTVLENQITKLQPLITERRLCGELDHPQSDTVRLSNASHLVTKLWMEENEVYGEAEVLNTPAGKVAQALISDGVKIGISSRGLGTLSEGVYGKSKTVNDDFRLVTFDLVADPSTRGAYPTLSESVMYTDEKYKRTLDQAISEKVFITMLKNRLNEGVSRKDEAAKPKGRAKKQPQDSAFNAKDITPGNLGPKFRTKSHAIKDSNNVLLRLFRERMDELRDPDPESQTPARRASTRLRTQRRNPVQGTTPAQRRRRTAHEKGRRKKGGSGLQTPITHADIERSKDLPDPKESRERTLAAIRKMHGK